MKNAKFAQEISNFSYFTWEESPKILLARFFQLWCQRKDLESGPDPSIRFMDPRIRIFNKKLSIRNTTKDWLERVRGSVMRVAYAVGNYAEVKINKKSSFSIIFWHIWKEF